MADKERKTYTIRCGCRNCGYGLIVGFKLTIPLGETVRDQPCPRCGVKEVERA